MITPVRRTPPKLPRPYPAPLVSSPVVEDLVRQLDRVLPEKWGPVVNAFWRRHERRPVITGTEGSAELLGRSVVVTFLWRASDAAEVLLYVNRLTDERTLADSLMRHVAGTDVWWLAYRMDPDWRASYAFVPRRIGEAAPWLTDDQVRLRQVLDRGLPDPGNEVTCRNRSGILQSVVQLPAAPPQPWLASRPGVQVPLAEPCTGPGGRRLWISRPAELGPESPVIVVLDGDVWHGRPGESTQDLPTTLTNLAVDGLVPPALAIMIDSGGREQRWRDLDPASGIGGWLAEDLLGWVRDRFGVRAAPADVVVVGQSLGGLVALSAGITHSYAIGRVLAQSASLWLDDLQGALAGRSLTGSRFQIQVGRQEWVLRRPNLALARELRVHGADVSVAVPNGGHDDAWWRGGVADGLVQLVRPTLEPHQVRGSCACWTADRRVRPS